MTLNLLSHRDPKYVRRLVRELNHKSVNGFYYHGERYNRARYHDGWLEVTLGKFPWQVANPEGPFDDGQGNEICASRE